ncbi:MAG: all-trans-retinol 13,14-reductase, partial [Planctomycetes bacterium]|nr:all-trans-retinol 13,14-reductase [Planctomycetota bacterium]
KTPLYVHAIINSFFIQSAWRLNGGGSQLADQLSQIITSKGGQVLTLSEATDYVFEGKEIQALKLKNGSQILGKHFISNTHPRSTLEMVESGKLRKLYVDRLNHLPNSTSSFTVYCSLKRKVLKHNNHNTYCSLDENIWTSDQTNQAEGKWPQGLMFYTTEDSMNPGFAESLTLIAMMNFSDVRQWQDSKIGRRGKDYEDFKDMKAQLILNFATDYIPELESMIENMHTATPLTYRDYTGTFEGSMYGIIKDCQNPMKSFLSPATKIPNLKLTGQNVNLHGMLGVTMTSLITCAFRLDLNSLIEKIRKA